MDRADFQKMYYNCLSFETIFAELAADEFIGDND
jgi:hypothetical protein